MEALQFSDGLPRPGLSGGRDMLRLIVRIVAVEVERTILPAHHGRAVIDRRLVYLHDTRTEEAHQPLRQFRQQLLRLLGQAVGDVGGAAATRGGGR